MFILDSMFLKIFLKVKILRVLQKSNKQQKCQRIKLSAVTWSAAANITLRLRQTRVGGVSGVSLVALQTGCDVSYRITPAGLTDVPWRCWSGSYPAREPGKPVRYAETRLYASYNRLRLQSALGRF